MVTVERDWKSPRTRYSGPRRRKSLRSWATFEQEIASGMGVLPGREQQVPV